MKDKWYFQGVYMRDEKLPTSGSFLLNLENTSGLGTHWVGILMDKKYYYDPFGLKWPMELNKLKLKKYNIVQHQNTSTGLCALYCLYVITKFHNNVSIYDIIHFHLKPYKDKKNNHERLKNLLFEVQS